MVICFKQHCNLNILAATISYYLTCSQCKLLLKQNQQILYKWKYIFKTIFYFTLLGIFTRIIMTGSWNKFFHYLFSWVALLGVVLFTLRWLLLLFCSNAMVLMSWRLARNWANCFRNRNLSWGSVKMAARCSWPAISSKTWPWQNRWLTGQLWPVWLCLGFSNVDASGILVNLVQDRMQFPLGFDDMATKSTLSTQRCRVERNRSNGMEVWLS